MATRAPGERVTARPLLTTLPTIAPEPSTPLSFEVETQTDKHPLKRPLRRPLRLNTLRRAKMPVYRQTVTTSAIARRVLDACKTTDAAARVTYVATDHLQRTTVKLHASAASTLEALQQTLTEHFPLARVGASENVLDGSMAAEIVVPSIEDEWELALTAARRRRPVQALCLLGTFCAIAGLFTWAHTEGGLDALRSWANASAADPRDI